MTTKTQPRSASPSTPRRPPTSQPAPDFHGASILDEQGVETPIDESMVNRALDDLDAAWIRARERCRSREA